ncbi:MAG: RluA family pseudouridine synthase [Candidatus Absconditabacterales bacterium]
MQITIDNSNSQQRFDRFLRKYFKIYPKVKLSDIYSRIRTGKAQVNNKKVKENYRLKISDKIIIDEKADLGSQDKSKLVSPKERSLKKIDIEKIKKRILYEDDNRICLDKPAGIVIHPSNTHRNDLSMNDYLQKLTENNKNLNSETNSTSKPSFAYRLDKETSGILLAAKNYEALKYINKLVRERETEKYYFAVVSGKFPKHLLIDKPLEKQFNEKLNIGQTVVNTRYGVKAISECRNNKTITDPNLGEISVVKVKIETGRMHQIRVHLADAGFPILGDLVYGNPVANRLLYKFYDIKRQLLHCTDYSFYDMFGNKKIHLHSFLPEDFQKIIN